jgi:hypothetical protein
LVRSLIHHPFDSSLEDAEKLEREEKDWSEGVDVLVSASSVEQTEKKTQTVRIACGR